MILGNASKLLPSETWPLCQCCVPVYKWRQYTVILATKSSPLYPHHRAAVSSPLWRHHGVLTIIIVVTIASSDRSSRTHHRITSISTIINSAEISPCIAARPPCPSLYHRTPTVRHRCITAAVSPSRHPVRDNAVAASTSVVPRNQLQCAHSYSCL